MKYAVIVLFVDSGKGKQVERLIIQSNTQPTRCSSRIPKRPRRDASPPPPSSPKKHNATNNGIIIDYLLWNICWFN